MEDKLKPCPFCGGDGDIAEGQTYGFSRQYQPCCRNCGLTLDIYDTAAEAIAAWNRRATEPNEPLTLAELRNMDGEPVWVEFIETPGAEPIAPLWMIVDARCERFESPYEYVDLADDGCIAYRRKPEEVQG